MSNDYFQYQAAKSRQDELIRAAEQHRRVNEAARAARAVRSDGGTGEGGAPEAHHSGVRLFGRSPRPSAC